MVALPHQSMSSPRRRTDILDEQARGRLARRRRLIQLRPAALVTVTVFLMASFVAWRFDVFKSPASGGPPTPTIRLRLGPRDPQSKEVDQTLRSARPVPEVLSPSSALPAPEVTAEASTTPRHRPRRR